MKETLLNIGLLILRFASGGLMAINHGWGKLSTFSENHDDFYDWMGLGPTVSLVLTVFAEFFCGLFVLLGIGTRIFAIPLFITMAVAFFAVHAGDPFGKREDSFQYMILFLTVILAGPGKFSLDQLLFKKLV
jgi:putative oxidoreductase